MDFDLDPTAEGRRAVLHEILADESIDYESVAVLMLRADTASAPAIVDAETCPGIVVVAGLTPDRAPVLVFYDHESLTDLAYDALDMGSFSPDGELLEGDERLDSILDYFGIGLHGCAYVRPDIGAEAEEGSL